MRWVLNHLVWLLFWAPVWALGAYFFLERRNRK